MYVVGLIRIKVLPFDLNVVLWQKRELSKMILDALAKASNTINPILCRVPEYSGPMFPNPAMRYFKGSGN
jgi:hypothetical protein